MKRKLFVLFITGLIVGLFVIIGFISAGVAEEEVVVCTLVYCDCFDSEGENLVGEIPCNSCGLSDPVFLTWLFNVVRDCGAKEIIICEDGGSRDSRLDINEESCEYSFSFFGR